MKKQNNLKNHTSVVHEELLALVSLRLHQFISEINDGLVDRVSASEANDIVVNSLSINLGHVMGQLPPSDQRKYSVSVKKMIKEHTLLGTIQKDIHDFGQIGRA
jgi:hypothetical protein